MSAKGVLADGGTRLARRGQRLFRGFGIGAFATHCVMPVEGLVPVPDGVPLDVAALVSCGVATGAGAVLNVARPAPGDAVVVFGAGGVGLAAVMAAAASGCGPVVAVDPASHRRALALDLGATAAVEPPSPEAARAALTSAAGGSEIDLVVDAVGSAELVMLGYRLVRQGGTVVAVGLQEPGTEVRLPGPTVPLGHKRLLGCFMGGIDPQRDMPRLFALHRRGAFPIDRLVSERRPLREVAKALDELASSTGLRTVVVPTAT
jgi:Zn-dependent alcohol dehydrogenase